MLHLKWFKSVMIWGMATLLPAVLFFFYAPRIWPLVDFEYFTPDAKLADAGLKILERAGQAVPEGFAYSTDLLVAENALDHVVRTQSQTAADRLQRAGVPLVTRRLLFKMHGSPDIYGVQFGSQDRIVGWYRRLENDAPADSVSTEEARHAACAGLKNTLADLCADSTWTQVGYTRLPRELRVDHQFLFRRELLYGLRQELRAAVAGDRLIQAETSVQLPAVALRQQRSRQAHTDFLFYGAMVAMAVFAFAGLRVALQSLREGSAQPGRAARPVLLVGCCLVGTYFLDGARLFLEWDPLWPRGIAAFKTVVLRLAYDLPMLLLLFVLILAGDRCELQRGEDRAASLWDFLNVRKGNTKVGWDALRGLAVAFFSGVFLVLLNLFFVQTGGSVQLQPQGFFRYTLNSAAPGVSTLVFFLNIALLEELGYRYFAFSWLRSRFSGRFGFWLAVLIPSMIFGAIHAPMYFLPPFDPWWGRVVIMAGIGVIWSLAAWKWGILTVVIAHWTSDLFIFNWPRLAAGGWEAVSAALVIAVPVMLAFLYSGFNSRAISSRMAS